jgi:hypothetical protein
MVNLQVIYVRKESLAHYWPLCEAHIERGLLPAEGEANARHVLMELEAGRAQLIVGEDAQGHVHTALAVQFQNMPNYIVAHVYSIGGKGVMDNAHHWASIKAWMKTNGAVKVQGICRPAQARLWGRLGFESVYQVVRQDL